jgi:tryptophanyl-tRNA synthetase
VKKRLFSGIQPSGRLHIGNYLGAIKPWVSLQAKYQSIFALVDLHALTAHQDPVVLQATVREAAALLLAAGIDRKVSTLFVQSHLGAHAELAWILSCFTPMGWLRRMTQFKEKSAGQKEVVSTGLFTYPALMAADILLYRTDLVPVGEDQTQHLEFTRDIAQRFNTLYGSIFTLPEPLFPGVGGRIMGLQNPQRKMSKSDGQPANAIYLLDPPEDIRAKIMRAVTDSGRKVSFDEGRPGINNLLVMYQLLAGLTRAETEERFAGKGYADLKQALAETAIAELTPLQVRYRALAEDHTALDSLLREGAARVKPQAEALLDEVKRRVGLG